MKKTLTAFALTVVILLGAGLVLLASASTVRSQALYGSPYALFCRQVGWLLAAMLVFAFCSKFDYRLWKKYLTLPIGFFLVVVVLLVAVISPGIRSSVNGSYRWIKLGSFSFQPGEFAKLAVVVAIAVWMDRFCLRPRLSWGGEPLRRMGWLGRFWQKTRPFWFSAVIPAALVGVVALFLLLEPDFGATMVVCVLGVLMMFVAGTRLWHLLLIAACGIPPIALVIAANANRMNRIKAWLGGLWDKYADYLGFLGDRICNWLAANAESVATQANTAGDHLKQSLLAFQNGGPWGVGFNQSIQKYSYLPEAHTDFIFAIGAEEFGFLFSFGVVLVYAVLLVCGILISLRATDRLGRLLAFGMTMLLVFQAAFNIGVVTGCLPTKGLALPFVSYGGTNLITAFFAVGTLFNILMQIDAADGQIAHLVRDAIDTV